MSFREKLTWAQFVPLLVLSVYYVVRWVQRQQGAPEPSLTSAVFWLAILQIASFISVGISSRREPHDERDHQIECRANKVAFQVVFWSGWLLVIFALRGNDLVMGMSIGTIALVALLLGAELVREAVILGLYRSSSRA